MSLEWRQLVLISGVQVYLSERWGWGRGREGGDERAARIISLKIIIRVRILQRVTSKKWISRNRWQTLLGNICPYFNTACSFEENFPWEIIHPTFRNQLCGSEGKVGASITGRSCQWFQLSNNPKRFAHFTQTVQLLNHRRLELLCEIPQRLQLPLWLTSWASGI